MIKRIILVPFIVLLCQLIYVPAFAVKAYPFPLEVKQPDGTTVTILLHGDEFHHYKTSHDGYLLKENAKGFLTYATVSATGEIVESEYTAKDAPNRSASEIQFLKTANQAAMIQKVTSGPSKVKMLATQTLPQKVFPLTGSPKSLVILVNFTDTAFLTPSPQAAYTNLLNQVGYNTNGGTGSARDYFMACSYGKFIPTFDVVGPVNLPHPMNFYGKNDASGNDTNPLQMIIDACAAANTAGLDFTQYDTDNDGVIDNVFVYYAGYNEAEGGPKNSVWPHRWGVYPQSLFPADYNYTGTVASVTFDGKRLMDYACTSELKGNSGTNMCGVGTFCHEFGHVLGLPDYYDTSGTQSNTLGSWSIMDYGNYSNSGRTPPVYSVYDRFFLGWLAPEQKSATATLTLNPLYQGTTPPANTTNQAFLLSATTHNLIGNNPNPNEFFMLEYRQKTGWDTYLPAEGMCIWHIDFVQSVWDSNSPNNYTGTSQTTASHMHVYLQPLSGSLTTPGTAFTTGSFTPITWAGVDINRSLTNITKTTGNITFNFMPIKMTTSGSITGYTTTLGTPTAAQSINISASNLTGNLNVNFQNSIYFEVKLSTDATWSKSLSIAPVSGSVTATVQVRYNPLITGTQNDNLSISSSGLTPATFSLTGTATIGPNSPVIYVGKIDNTLQFSATKLNAVNIKSINMQAADLTGDLSLVITGANASMFTVLPGSILKTSATASSGYTFTVTYTPTTLGNHTATLTISGGGLNPSKVITLTGSGI
ncbi:MAG: M6 family metalloprotease domain-containing protein [Paludibacter sp.]|nr:M6 family metalloprotease domain-containing protein [Paludibacter sp.]